MKIVFYRPRACNGKVKPGKKAGMAKSCPARFRGTASIFLFAVKSCAARPPPPFLYLGVPRFVGWQGEKPITIDWDLPEPVPEHFRKMLRVP